MTSDQFFEEEATLALGESMIDVAQVDGLHEFEQTLRDVLNLERFMAPGGLIVLDDCNPRTRERAGDVVTGGAWNGDVWKVAAFLVNERPDLHYVTVDADEGIGLVNGFSGNHAFPTAETVAIYKKLDYSLLDEKRDQVLNLIPPTSVPRFL